VSNLFYGYVLLVVVLIRCSFITYVFFPYIEVGHPEEFASLVRAFVETGEAPDFISIDGSEGGTGAAPPEFSNSVGMPLSFGLSYAHAMLVGAGLRDPVDKSQSKVTLIGSGKVCSGFSM
jgi:glutamate synthase domain-containing protein 2